MEFPRARDLASEGMGLRCALAATLALVVAPAAWAHRPVTVGYGAPSSLRGLDVVRRVDALRIAEVRGATVRELRQRDGIRWAEPSRRRGRTDEPALALAPGALGAAPEWQWTATRSDLVPEWVERAAAAVTIAVVDTGADLTAPDLAAKHPVTHNVATGG